MPVIYGFIKFKINVLQLETDIVQYWRETEEEEEV